MGLFFFILVAITYAAATIHIAEVRKWTLAATWAVLLIGEALIGLLL